MQDRYAGDIGDYGKLGLLRTLQSSGFSIGVNWYLTPDEKHNDDGKHTEYLEKNLYRNCDEDLWNELKTIVDAGNRTISALEKNAILNAAFYSECLDFSDKSKPERDSSRNAWHRAALTELAGNDIVFVDPDNGMLVRSAEGSRRENKFVKPQELKDYYDMGSSIVYYQHKARRKDQHYIDQNESLLKDFRLNIHYGLGLKFKTTSLRYYFFIIQPRHKESITNAVRKMLAGPWREHFLYYNPKQGGVFSEILQKE